MKIAVLKEIAVFNAGLCRASSEALSSEFLVPEHAEAWESRDTDEIKAPQMLRESLEQASLFSELDDFFPSALYRSEADYEDARLLRGHYELIQTQNPYRHEHKNCRDPWFVVAGIRERIGMPPVCWAEEIKRGNIVLLSWN